MTTKSVALPQKFLPAGEYRNHPIIPEEEGTVTEQVECPGCEQPKPKGELQPLAINVDASIDVGYGKRRMTHQAITEPLCKDCRSEIGPIYTPRAGVIESAIIKAVAQAARTRRSS